MSGGSQGGLGSPQSVVNAADPLNIFGHSSNSVMGNIVDPGGLYGPGGPFGPAANASGAPSVLPNLGGNSMMPIQPYGKFMAPDTSDGGFNAMAARAAGPLFDPSTGAPSWQALMAAVNRAGSSGGATQPAMRNQATLPARRIQP
jgi:hypothetical protein